MLSEKLLLIPQKRKAFLEGVAAKVFVTKRSAIRSGFEMLLVGGLAALVAFGVGTFLKNLVGHP